MLVDSNEPGDIIAELGLAGIPVEVTQLRPAADYIIGKFAIERKSNNNFYQSIYSRQLFDQLKRLNDMEEYKPILAIHGPIPCTHKWMRARGRPVKLSLSNDEKAQKERTAMSAFATSVNSYDRVSLITFKSQEQFIKFIVDLYYRQTQKAKKPSAKKRAETVGDIKWNMFCQFPGIGSKGATTLLKSELTINQLADMEPDEIAKRFSGIGLKRAKAIVEILNS